MKKITIVIVATILVFAGLSAFTIASSSAVILEKLGVNESNARYAIDEIVFRNRLYLPKASLLGNVVNGDKTAAALELAQYIKSYTQSEAFKLEYEKLRLESKPTFEPDPIPKGTINTMKETLVTMEEMANNKDFTAYMSKSDIENMKKSIEDMRLEIQKAMDPTPNKTKWEKEYPASVNVLIKKRLEDYLALSVSVDYNAQLTTNQYNKKIFVNPDYERKSAAWKACFRAGKDVNDQLRVFVAEWLKEL